MRVLVVAIVALTVLACEPARPSETTLPPSPPLPKRLMLFQRSTNTGAPFVSDITPAADDLADYGVDIIAYSTPELLDLRAGTIPTSLPTPTLSRVAAWPYFRLVNPETGVEQIKAIAQLAAANGTQGMIFDNEAYDDWRGPGTLELGLAAAAAIDSVVPDGFEVFTFIGPAWSSQTVFNGTLGAPEPYLPKYQEVGAFAKGLAEGLRGTGVSYLSGNEDYWNTSQAQVDQEHALIKTVDPGLVGHSQYDEQGLDRWQAQVTENLNATDPGGISWLFSSFGVWPGLGPGYGADAVASGQAQLTAVGRAAATT